MAGLKVNSLPHTGPIGDGVSLKSMAHPAAPKPRIVTLSAAQRQAAKNLGMSELEYARAVYGGEDIRQHSSGEVIKKREHMAATAEYEALAKAGEELP